MISVQLLLIFMIITAIIAIELKDMISSVIALGCLGFALSLTFLVLKAPDLAVILLIVEIVTLALLTKATIETSHVSPKGFDLLISGTVIAFLGFFLTIAYFAVLEIPKFGEPIMRVAKYYITESFSAINALNIVTAIAVGFRGYDTLGAVLVLFTVTVGTKLITDRSRRNDEWNEHNS